MRAVIRVKILKLVILAVFALFTVLFPITTFGLGGGSSGGGGAGCDFDGCDPPPPPPDPDCIYTGTAVVRVGFIFNPTGQYYSNYTALVANPIRQIYSDGILCSFFLR